ncbi:MAG: tetratricopeptide repeat protein [Parvularculaceae bacterium]
MRAALALVCAFCSIAAPVRAATGLTPADDVFAALEAADHARALALAEPLAAQGDIGAHVALGRIYERGLGVRPNIGLALEHYSAAATQGSADAQLALGRLAYEGGGVYPDYERAAGWFRLAAAKGDARAEVRLGRMFADGKGVRQDSVAAVNHFARAAAKNNADGLFYLGLANLRGDGVPQSYQRAATYFEGASSKSHAEAAYHLALMHDSTVLGRPDAAEAARLMRLAAEGGYAPAFAAMGLIVHRGDAEGVAADWFERGAAAGDPQATLLYAVALSKGDGRPKDAAGAMRLSRKLVEEPQTPDAIRAQAKRLEQTLARQVNGPITLRD